MKLKTILDLKIIPNDAITNFISLLFDYLIMFLVFTRNCLLYLLKFKILKEKDNNTLKEIYLVNNEDFQENCQSILEDHKEIFKLNTILIYYRYSFLRNLFMGIISKYIEFFSSKKVTYIYITCNGNYYISDKLCQPKLENSWTDEDIIKEISIHKNSLSEEEINDKLIELDTYIIDKDFIKKYLLNYYF